MMQIKLHTVMIVLVIRVYLQQVTSLTQCAFLDDVASYPDYNLVKVCHRSDSNIIYRANYESLEECAEKGYELKAFALNYSPPGIFNDSELENMVDFYNCEILSCPELLALTNDSRYDYYSMYGNIESIVETTCVPALGLFRLFMDSQNYTMAMEVCEDFSGALANIITEFRTNTLSNKLNAEMEEEWFKAAYVGLDDMEYEGRFVSSVGEPLNCFKFRSWAPGHPRSKTSREDCVILDSERLWRAIDCRIAMPFLCEIFPSPVPDDFEIQTCKQMGIDGICIASDDNSTETSRCWL